MNLLDYYAKYSEALISHIVLQDLDYESIPLNDSIYIDLVLLDHVEFCDLQNDLHQHPTEIIKSFDKALLKCFSSQISANNTQSQNTFINISTVTTRFLGYSPLTPFKDIKSQLYQKYVSVKGVVVKVGNIKPQCSILVFECIKCKNHQVRVLQEGKMSYPSKCTSGDCNGHSFIPLFDSDRTQFYNSQNIRLQEIEDDIEQREIGRIPRHIDCLLSKDLVNCNVPGDVLVVSGIVKALQSDEFKGRNESSMYNLYIEANSVVNPKENHLQAVNQLGKSALNVQNKMAGMMGDSNGQEEFSIEDLRNIEKIKQHPDLFNLLINSLCPSIYGHHVVKSALLLSLFGGSENHGEASLNESPTRENIHILIVGDPGLGKSQMLKAMTNLASRGVYVCGNTSTTAGLTITLTKDGANGDHSLEAGALVLSDNGTCCIDEFDKMSAQHSTLLEAMEQQTVSLAKAGVLCSLPTRTSVIAAANPHGSGHYDKSKTVSQNLKIDRALLSRFDLVFIMRDKADHQRDIKLSEHVMAHHGDDTSREPFGESNKIDGSKNDIPIVPTTLLKQYIRYAKKHANQCQLDDSAKTLLQHFYIHMRQNFHSADVTITIRQLESLIRLTQARAKAELKKIATGSDAQQVIDIMKYSLWGSEYHVVDEINSQQSVMLKNKSKSQTQRFLTILSVIAEKEGNIITHPCLLKIIKESKINIKDPIEFIDALNYQGFLISKGESLYKIHI